VYWLIENQPPGGQRLTLVVNKTRKDDKKADKPAKRAAKPVKAGKRKNDGDTGALGRKNDKEVKAADSGKVNVGKKVEKQKIDNEMQDGKVKLKIEMTAPTLRFRLWSLPTNPC